MPVFIHLANLIVNKDAVIKNYLGGIEQFRIDFSFGDDNYNQEDNHLFCIARMNVDEFDIDFLIEKGLHFDSVTQKSTDFTIRPRYGTYLWETKWVKDNQIFAWHVLTPAEQIHRANSIANLSMDEIGVLADRGEQPFATII